VTTAVFNGQSWEAGALATQVQFELKGQSNSGAAPATVVETIRIFGHCTFIVWEGDTN
jgi:hypothetical protein